MLMSLNVQNQPTRNPVTTLMVYITEECNLRCSYCFVEKKPRHMTADTAQKVLEFFLRPEISGDAPELKLNFFGGEPFLKIERMEELWRSWRAHPSFARRKLTLSATTNGTLAGPRIERLVREAGMPLLISLDGDAAANRERPFVSGRASYDVVAANLPKLVQWSPSPTLRLTFHPGSFDLVGSVKHARELGKCWVVLAPVVEADWRGLEEQVEERFQELAEWFCSEVRANRPPPLQMTWAALRRWHRLHPRGLRPARPCPVGDSLMAVDPDGQVMPCHRFLYRRSQWLGDVHQPRLEKPRDEYVHLRSEQILGCDDCVARSICGGGCRVVSMQSGGGLYGTHPHHCTITRAHARAVARIYEFLKTLPQYRPLFESPSDEPDLDEAWLEGTY